MMKKTVSILLTILLVLGTVAFALTANAEGEPGIVASGYCGANGNEENVTWTFYEDGLFKISGTGAMTDYLGLGFRHQTPAYRYRDRLVSAVIDSGITNIGDSAFYQCTKLTSIVIPEGVTKIGKAAFYGCKALADVTLPDSLLYVGGNAFLSTAWFNALPNGLVYLGKTAYSYKGTMPQNTSIALNDDCLAIAASAFRGCTNLVDITIPDSVTTIGGGAFHNTAWYNAKPDGLVVIGKTVYGYKGEMPENTNLVLPDGCEEICGSAFNNCQNLTGITIPDSITAIPSYAFDECKGLKQITIPDSVTSIGEMAFFDSGLESIHVPDSVTTIGESAFSVCSSLKDVTIGNGVTVIESELFAESEYMESVRLGNRVKRIETYAFRKVYTTGGMDIYIPASVESIGYGAFLACCLNNVFYAGSEAQWNQIDVNSENNQNAHLYRGVIHYNATGHTPAPAVHENEIAATCTEAGGYDEVIYCTKCPAEISRTHIDVPAPGHNWGEWVVVKQATTDEEGLMRRTCQNNAEHVEEQVIPKLQPQTNVFQQFIERIKGFFEGIADWFSRLFRW